MRLKIWIKNMENTSTTKLNFGFWLHLFITILAWVGPFLIDWRLMGAAYLIVQIQFIVFKECLMNKSHGIDEVDNNATFYSEIFDLLGLNIPKRPVKLFVRNALYIVLGLVGFVWQYLLHNEVLFTLPF